MKQQDESKDIISKTKSYILSKKPWLRRHWKRVVIFGVPLILILFSILKPKGFDQSTEILEIAKVQDLKKTVQASGTVTSIVDLGLGFNTPGTVQSVNAQVGTNVKKGQILASLNAQSELGALNQALGSLKAAQAALVKTKEGATNEEIAVIEAQLNSAEVDLDNIQKRENITVSNAFRTLTSSSLVAVPKDGSALSMTAPTISGTYNGNIFGEYILSVHLSGTGYMYSTSGISSSSGVINSGVPQPLGVNGLFVTFPNISESSSARWIIEVPNKQSTSYATNFNAYTLAQENRDASIRSAEALINQRKAELAFKKASARPADLALREADVLTAEGRVQAAQGAYEDKVIRAPASGTITRVDIKPGQLVESKKPVVVLQDTGSLYVEANVNEAAIAELSVGQSVTFTVDTYGPAETFEGIVTDIDLAPTLDGDIVNYKVKAEITTGLDKIKTGSTANISILISQKPQVVAIPERVLNKKDGKTYVSVVIDERRGKTKEHEVVTGEKGDGGLIEVVSGLSQNEKVLFRAK